MADHACRWCGKTEPNEFLLEINHWPDAVPSVEHSECIAMTLTRSHVVSAAARVRKWHIDAKADLRGAIERAEEVWPADRRDWIEQFRDLAREVPAPGHRQVRVSADPEPDLLDLLSPGASVT